jgi:1,4-dihydroxy-2-naphthoyl-CoA hydrolase
MTFDEYIGMEHSHEDGETSARVRIAPHHCNATGNINGGVFLTMADNVSTGAANRAYFEKTGERKFLVGIDLHAVMLANQQGGTIRAVAVPVRVGRRITVVRTQVFGEDDLLLAEVTTTHVPT